MSESKENTITLNIDSIAMPFAIVLSVIIFSVSFLIGMNNLSNAIEGSDGVRIGGDSGNTDDAIDSFADTGDAVDPALLGENTTATVNVAGSPTLGSSDAKIAVVEFTDYECPFCARFKTDTFDQIRENFVDTGDVQFVTENFPLSFHVNAERYANAAECTFDSGGTDAFYAFKDVAFDRIAGGETLDADALASIASDVGANKGDVESCIENDSFVQSVQDDFSKGTTAGITGTPGFIIGIIDGDGNVDGELLSGAQPYASFEAAIERQLERV